MHPTDETCVDWEFLQSSVGDGGPSGAAFLARLKPKGKGGHRPAPLLPRDRPAEPSPRYITKMTLSLNDATRSLLDSIDEEFGSLHSGSPRSACFEPYLDARPFNLPAMAPSDRGCFLTVLPHAGGELPPPPPPPTAPPAPPPETISQASAALRGSFLPKAVSTPNARLYTPQPRRPATETREYERELEASLSDRLQSLRFNPEERQRLAVKAYGHRREKHENALRTLHVRRDRERMYVFNAAPAMQLQRLTDQACEREVRSAQAKQTRAQLKQLKIERTAEKLQRVEDAADAMERRAVLDLRQCAWATVIAAVVAGSFFECAWLERLAMVQPAKSSLLIRSPTSLWRHRTFIRRTGTATRRFATIVKALVKFIRCRRRLAAVKLMRLFLEDWRTAHIFPNVVLHYYTAVRRVQRAWRRHRAFLQSHHRIREVQFAEAVARRVDEIEHSLTQIRHDAEDALGRLPEELSKHKRRRLQFIEGIKADARRQAKPLVIQRVELQQLPPFLVEEVLRQAERRKNEEHLRQIRAYLRQLQAWEAAQRTSHNAVDLMRASHLGSFARRMSEAVSMGQEATGRPRRDSPATGPTARATPLLSAINNIAMRRRSIATRKETEQELFNRQLVATFALETALTRQVTLDRPELPRVPVLLTPDELHTTLQLALKAQRVIFKNHLLQGDDQRRQALRSILAAAPTNLHLQDDAAFEESAATIVDAVDHQHEADAGGMVMEHEVLLSLAADNEILDASFLRAEHRLASRTSRS